MSFLAFDKNFDRPIEHHDTREAVVEAMKSRKYADDAYEILDAGDMGRKIWARKPSLAVAKKWLSDGVIPALPRVPPLAGPEEVYEIRLGKTED